MIFVFEFYFHYEPGKTGGRKARSQRRQNWYNPKLVTKLGMKGKMFAICHLMWISSLSLDTRSNS